MTYISKQYEDTTPMLQGDFPRRMFKRYDFIFFYISYIPPTCRTTKKKKINIQTYRPLFYTLSFPLYFLFFLSSLPRLYTLYFWMSKGRS